MITAKKTNSGQATMELILLMLAFLICFLGLVVVMGLSIANIEIFGEAKFNSEQNAQYADYGDAGVRSNDILKWKYTVHDLTSDEIPFLPKDEPQSLATGGNLMQTIDTNLNDKAYSSDVDEAPQKYKFNEFSINLTGAPVFDTTAPAFDAVYRSANLLEGRTKYGENIATIHASERSKMYKAIEKILSLKRERLIELKLEDNVTNRVFFPAMKVSDK